MIERLEINSHNRLKEKTHVPTNQGTILYGVNGELHEGMRVKTFAPRGSSGIEGPESSLDEKTAVHNLKE